MIRLIPWPQFDAETSLVRHLVRHRPWIRADGETDTALRAAFRRWTPADVEPSLLMLAPLWTRVPADGWRGLDTSGTDRAVHHAALVLHLLSLGLDPDEPGQRTYNLGEAAYAASVAEGRFARLVNTPAPARLEALGRLFRRLRQQNVHLRLTADRPEADGADRRSTRATLHDRRFDDLASMLAFLFTDAPKPSVSRWAAGYYHRTERLAETAESTT